MSSVSVVALTTKSHQNLVFKNKFVYMPKNFHVCSVTEAAKVSFQSVSSKIFSGKATYTYKEMRFTSLVLFYI